MSMGNAIFKMDFRTPHCTACCDKWGHDHSCVEAQLKQAEEHGRRTEREKILKEILGSRR